jgi:hypothetical protein
MPSFGEGGSWSGHLRLRAAVDVGNPGPNTTSVTVRLRVWVETDGWNFNDGQTVSFSGWKSGSVNFTNNLSSGDKLVVDKSWSHSVGSSRVNRSFSAKLSGNNATGSSPSVSVSWYVPGRPVSPPSPPSYASMGVSREGGADDWHPTYRVYWGYTTDNGGDPVSTWTLQLDDFDTFATPIAGANLQGGVRRYITGTFSPGRRYWYRVRGNNSAGAGAWRTKTFDAPGVQPQVPVWQSTTSITKTSAVLNWVERLDGGDPVNRSQVDVRRESDSVIVYSETVNTGSTSRTVSGLAPGTAYRARIRLGNNRGLSGFTAWTDVFTTAQSEPRNRPNATVAIVDSTTARLSWTHTLQSGDAPRTGFEYQVSTSSNFSSLFDSGTVSSSTTQKQVGGMTPATQYYFRVRAKSAIGDGPWSAVKSLTAPQGIRVRLDGAWVPKPLYVWMDGEWVVPTSIKGRSGGAWVEAS